MGLWGMWDSYRELSSMSFCIPYLSLTCIAMQIRAQVLWVHGTLWTAVLPAILLPGIRGNI